jgi:hypothetical protein
MYIIVINPVILLSALENRPIETFFTNKNTARHQNKGAGHALAACTAASGTGAGGDSDAAPVGS